jgi:hypothetical protein
MVTLKPYCSITRAIREGFLAAVFDRKSHGISHTRSALLFFLAVVEDSSVEGDEEIAREPNDCPSGFEYGAPGVSIFEC